MEGHAWPGQQQSQKLRGSSRHKKMLSEELAMSAEVVRHGARKGSDDKPPFWPVWGIGTLS